MSVKVVLQNAKTQLEAQKKGVYSRAYESRIGELKPTLDDYVKVKTEEKMQAEAALTEAYTRAIESKKSEIETQAEFYATAQCVPVDNTIKELEKMIESAEE